VPESSNQFDHNLHIDTVIAPEAPTVSGGTPKAPETPQKENKNILKKVVIGGTSVLAAGALAVGGYLMLNPSNNEPGTAPEKTPDGTSGETVTHPSFEALKIPAGLSDEAVGKMITEDIFTKWINAGASVDLVSEAVDKNVTVEDLIATKAVEQAEAQADAIFVEGWRDIPELRAVVYGDGDLTGFMEVNTKIMTNFLPAWKETGVGYTQSERFEEVRLVSSAEGERTLEIDYTNYDNSGASGTPPLDASDLARTMRITLVTTGDVEQISSIDIFPR